MQITATNLFKEYDSTLVFDSVTFSISPGEKIGLVGYNGSGKSTLLKILAGVETQDSGTLHIPKGMIIGYVPQDTVVNNTETISTYIHSVASSSRGEQYAIQPHTIKEVLEGFGISNIELDTPLQQLSAGQKTKVFLTAALLIQPDILLLDEPTNNLDLTALLWLENFLEETDTACVIISHDRHFLDTIVRTIFELNWESKKLTITHGTYTDYLDRLKKEQVRQGKAHQEHKSDVKKAKNLVRKSVDRAEQGNNFTPKDNDKQSRGYFRDRTKGTGKLIQAYKKRLDHMEDVEQPVERYGLSIDINSETSGGVKDISLQELVAGYACGIQLTPLTLHIAMGDRLVILGDNGSGKSTLLKTILGKITPITGSVTRGSAVKIANFTQEHESLPRDKTLLEFLHESTHAETYDIYNIARKYGFKEHELKKELQFFSPGGRARILFALFTLQSVNVLLLDEPTNHLDMEAAEALEKMLKDYQGTIILISHDRHLLELMAPDHILLISTGGIITKEADMYDYIQQAQVNAGKIGTIV